MQPPHNYVVLMSLLWTGFLLASTILMPTAEAAANAKTPTSVVASKSDIPQTTLATGQSLPLVGYGVGNLRHDLITSRIAAALQDDMKTVLIDTAHASQNEALVRDGIVQGIHNLTNDKEVHVITKVWYTYLGYERTKFSVKTSLEALKLKEDSSNALLRVHVLLHWPRCMDEIPWMNCQEEEDALPDFVKEAGPAPHLHKDTAFLDSWRALEDVFTGELNLGDGLPKVASIGLSNFPMDDLQALAKVSRVTPHILQDNVWSFMYDPFLVDYCRERNIHFQAYNVMNGIFSRHQDAPLAYHILLDVTERLSSMGGGERYGPGQTVLKWFVQNQVSVIPRTTNVSHLKDNSAKAIASMPDLDQHQQDIIRVAITALLRGRDLERPVAHIHNSQKEGLLDVFWVNEASGEEVSVKEGLKPSEQYSTVTNSGHKFVAYADAAKTMRKELVVEAGFGEHVNFHVDEF